MLIPTCPFTPYVSRYRGESIHLGGRGSDRLVMHAYRCPACFAALIGSAGEEACEAPLSSEILTAYVQRRIGSADEGPGRSLRIATLRAAIADHLCVCSDCLARLDVTEADPLHPRLAVDLDRLLTEADVAVTSAIEAQLAAKAQSLRASQRI
ncbi:MAG: hypothetical protein HY369_01410 [Candidatus Aenigmarchaeota archaeon]|nr:hypothetical protein [Candidatus Aenigmarchaeota archaeon]